MNPHNGKKHLHNSVGSEGPLPRFQQGCCLAKTGWRPKRWVKTVRPNNNYAKVGERTKRSRRRAVHEERAVVAGSEPATAQHLAEEIKLASEDATQRTQLLEEAGLAQARSLHAPAWL